MTILKTLNMDEIIKITLLTTVNKNIGNVTFIIVVSKVIIT